MSDLSSTTPSAVPRGRSVSIDQAALLLNVSRRTIYNRIREGRLRTMRTLGGSQRVLVDSLHALVPSHVHAVRVGAGQPVPFRVD